jgi:hypothetical protein
VRFIVDDQLTPALAHWLVEAGHDAKHVEEVGLREAEDQPIWRYALDNQAVILTKDGDFADRVRQSPKSPDHLAAHRQCFQPGAPALVWSTAAANHRLDRAGPPANRSALSIAF